MRTRLSVLVLLNVLSAFCGVGPAQVAPAPAPGTPPAEPQCLPQELPPHLNRPGLMPPNPALQPS